jgi:D-3-phosphoglycerate dehydrogenase|tara:strand:+ start:191 stop:1405 length:1215 start_codon:yes stop_codon:yes gene_type:complete
LDKKSIKILLLEGIHRSARESFIEAGYDNIDCVDRTLHPDDLMGALQGVHMLGIRSRSQLTERVFEGADRLMAVGCFCIGTNQVDLQGALLRGVPVFNAPFSNTRSVAELVIAEAILLLRGIPEKNALSHRGVWQKSASNSFEIRGKTLGIIGYGNIGSQVSVLAESLGMRVFYYDIVTKLSLGNAEQLSTLQALLAGSDIVSLHVPETPVTRNMIGASELAAMKPGSVLLNASRGTVIDLDALTDSLRCKHLLGAAVDVFPQEPESNAEEFVSTLQEFDNCILTPHVGGSTLEAQENIGREVATKLIKYCDNGSTISSVNFPEVALPAHPGSHRILHIHENIPGVLSDINGFFSANGININAQHLQTNESVGYVVTDISQEYSAIALKELRSVAGTIRTRVLF